jgi:hypothetical protein
MKRLITCAALMLVAAVVVFTNFRERSRLRAGDELFRSSTFESDFQDAAAVEPNPLREQVLERLKAKVELMTDEELKQTLQTTDAEIRTMQAKQELDQTTEILRRIVSGFEGTSSAVTAQAMIQVYENRHATTPGGDAPFYGAPGRLVRPVPDYPDGRAPTPSRPLQPVPDDQQPVPAREAPRQEGF